MRGGIIMEDPGEKQNAQRKSHPLAFFILGAALLVASGLAIGLGLGLRSLEDGKPEAIPTTTEIPEPQRSRSGDYRFAAVTSDADICSDIGTKILAVNQGSAVDAAIAVMLCIGVVHRQSCGIGGGFFMTIYNRSTETAEVIDARERAPLAANSTMYIGREIASTLGGLAVGVPGDIKGHWEAHQRYGRLPWRDLFQPTIALCRKGVKLNQPILKAIHAYAGTLKNMSHDMYFHPETGEIKKLGDTVKYPLLANTLETIADEGAAAFYSGSLTDKIVADVQEHGGIITREDLNQYEVAWRTPLNVSLRDHLTIYSNPPPGSGAVYAYILSILDGYKFTPDDLSTNEKRVLTYHRIVEAMKFAYAKRSSLGDQDFVNLTELMGNMTSREYADSIRALISDDRTHDVMYYGPTYYDQTKTGTSHASVIDAHGNTVAVTATINTLFGSKIHGRRTGIAFNNEMDDFSTPGLVNIFGVSPSEANFIQPKKRPVSSMCPSIIVNRTSGDVVMAIGSAGGTRITTATALVSAFTLWLGLPISDAVDHHRLHHQLLPHHIVAEEGFDQEIINGLKAKGHEVTFHAPQSAVNVLHSTGSRIHGVGDVRKGGAPSGY